MSYGNLKKTSFIDFANTFFKLVQKAIVNVNFLPKLNKGKNAKQNVTLNLGEVFEMKDTSWRRYE